MIDRRTLVLSLAATAAFPQAFAQAWPAKPIRIIVPFPAGQATDAATTGTAAAPATGSTNTTGAKTVTP